MEISIISDIFTVFLPALLRLGRILPGFFAPVYLTWLENQDLYDSCDGKRNTVTITQKGQYVFGGYTDIP